MKNVYWSACKLPVIEYSRQIFEKKGQISNFMKIPLMGAELFPTDGQT